MKKSIKYSMNEANISIENCILYSDLTDINYYSLL